VDGDSNYVRIQVLTNAGALDRDKQIALVGKMTDLVTAAAKDPDLKTRTWVLLAEAAPEAGACGDTRTRTRSSSPPLALRSSGFVAEVATMERGEARCSRSQYWMTTKT